MNPCDLNVVITAITNHLYNTLDQKDFDCLTIFLSELSKSMFSMALLRTVCDRERERREPYHKKEQGKKNEEGE